MNGVKYVKRFIDGVEVTEPAFPDAFEEHLRKFVPDLRMTGHQRMLMTQVQHPPNYWRSVHVVGDLKGCDPYVLRVVEVLRRLSLGDFPVPWRAEVRPFVTNRRSVALRVEIRVPDRDTGATTSVQQEVEVDCLFFAGATPEVLVDALYRKFRFLVISLLEHEVDEWLTFDGQQVVDPHAGEP